MFNDLNDEGDIVGKCGSEVLFSGGTTDCNICNIIGRKIHRLNEFFELHKY